jgi:hypothetical protein
MLAPLKLRQTAQIYVQGEIILLKNVFQNRNFEKEIQAEMHLIRILTTLWQPQNGIAKKTVSSIEMGKEEGCMYTDSLSENGTEKIFESLQCKPLIELTVDPSILPAYFTVSIDQIVFAIILTPFESNFGIATW